MTLYHFGLFCTQCDRTKTGQGKIAEEWLKRNHPKIYEDYSTSEMKPFEDEVLSREFLTSIVERYVRK